MPEPELLDVVEDLYDAAAGGVPWSHVCTRLTQVVGAQSASLMIGDFSCGRTELFFHGDFPPDAIAAYRTYYHSVDLWTRRAARTAMSMNGKLTASFSGHLVSDAEFLRSEFYQDFGRPLGLRYVVGSVIPLGEAGLAPIGLHRSEGAEPFGREHAQLLEIILPHLRRAIQLRHRLQTVASTEAPSLAALDALNAGVLVLDGELRVHLANIGAEALAKRGLLRLRRMPEVGARSLTVAEAVHRDDHASFARLVKETAAGRSAGGVRSLRAEHTGSVGTVVISPLPARLSDNPLATGGRVANRALAIVREVVSASHAPDRELLRSLFGLTSAEADVACALVGGTTKASVAALRQSSLTTVRTQVRAILEKTGSLNLRDLERLLSRLEG